MMETDNRRFVMNDFIMIVLVVLLAALMQGLTTWASHATEEGRDLR